ncbi:MAG: HEAT repeat domain-containing protein, partial [Verrucomicrobiota bacterium]
SEFGEKSQEELAILLGHADLRVRQRAQFQLAKSDDARAVFQEALQSENQLTRLHGVWGLWQVGIEDGAESVGEQLLALIDDEDSEIQAQSARVLGDLRYAGAGSSLAQLMTDESLRVRSFAAIAIGRCGYSEGTPALLAALETNANRDEYLRHACVLGLHYLGDEKALAALADHPNAAVRLGAALALRRSKNPDIARFLDDADPLVVHAAIRAINDLHIDEATPALAAKLSSIQLAAETPQQWILLTRLINANFRDGSLESAGRLFAFVARDELPIELRNDALRALADWSDPSIVDPTVALVRPISSDRADIAPVVAEFMPEIQDSLNGELIRTAIMIATDYDYVLPAAILRTALLDTENAAAVRIEILANLTEIADPELPGLLEQLLGDADAEIRAAAMSGLKETDPKRALDGALAWLQSKNPREQQLAIGLLAESNAKRATDALGRALDQAIAGKFPKTALLELLDAAAERPEFETQLVAYQEKAEPFAESEQGGDSARGKRLFETHAAAQCNKCHKIGGVGGVAGPDLSDIGKRYDHAYLLESLINPSEVIVPGYGLMIATLKDGSVVAGALVEEDEETITLKTGEEETQKIARTEIASSNPPISAMPPMTAILNKRELRDLVAYLVEQKTKPKGH